jgi:serine/threonine protein kinase
MDQSNDPPNAADDSRFEDAIAGYLDDVSAGTPNPEKLLAAHPDLADELRAFLRDHHHLMRIGDLLKVGDNAAEQAGNSTPHDSTGDGTAGPQLALNVPTSKHDSEQSQSPGLGRFGDYDLLHEIARGGMGVVYKAHQVSLNRTVAVKMILRGTLAGGEDIERFTLEAKAVAKLCHPQIVVIHDVGQCDDQYFYSMEYIEGRSLAEMIRSGPVNCRRAAEYVEQVARAIDFAHQNNIVHRDIKPSNVLVDASGRARVTDFGLAKHVDRGEELTLTGQIIGTPAYMAPEQITNRRGEIGPACDVYGMGALLYELLTGRTPFKGRDQFNTLLQVLDCEPQSPREVNHDVPRELEAICLKCLEKDPRRRYASAADLADDLNRYMSGDPISVHGHKIVGRLVRILGRSQYDREFYTWSRILLYVGGISLVTHILVFLNHKRQSPHPLAQLIPIRVGELVAMGAVLWWLRSEWFPPRGAPTRQLLSLWVGYLAGSTTLVLITYLLTPAGAPFDDFLAYPPMAVLASLLFMMLGSSYWGYCYVIGSMFLVIAIVTSCWLTVAPLVFGAAWAACLVILSGHLGRLAENQ